MEFLGAHVSTAGGIDRAPERGTTIGATAIQVFTKVPNQWREPVIADDVAERFDQAMTTSDIRAIVSHDSYLINLASPDRSMRLRSIECFKGELERCATLGIPYIVSHPGNFMDDQKRGLQQNADSYAECLDAVEGPTVLIETTAGSGTALGSKFEELAELRDKIPPSLRDRVGFCADTCHMFSAGYDLINDFDGVWRNWDSTLGLENLHCLHLNDSKTPFASNRDRHELIGEGSLGPEPFRKIMKDPRFENVIKLLETPKGDDPVQMDRRMLARLRGYR